MNHVEFIFRCDDCNVASTFGKKGRENHVPWQCPDCKRKLKVDNSKKGRKYITKKHCDFCGYDHEDVFELSLRTKEKAPNKEEVRKFREDKLRFCLSLEDGMKYLESQRSMQRLSEIFKEMDGKKDEPKVKIMSIKEAQSALKKILKGAGCENVRFLDPEIGHDVVFQFKAIDSMGRDAYDAKKILKKAIKNGFEGTNWSLMSEGIGFKLGILDGRMRGKEGNAFVEKSIIF